MVFQKPNPFAKSIYDNVAWAPRNLGLRAGLDERVERALRGAALWDEVKDRLKSSALGLSGGQQQRLCIARAIAVEPDVLLLDEPASALDPIATGAIEDLIHVLKRRYTIVIVTHNMQQAARVADRTAFFSLDANRDRHADRGRRHRPDLHQPARSAHAGLRHRPLRLIGGCAGRRRRRLSPADAGAGVGSRRTRRRSRRWRPARAATGRTASRTRRPPECGAPQLPQAAGAAGVLHAQDPLDLTELGVGVLEQRRALDDHVDPDAVADRHLVDQSAEIPLQLGHPCAQLLAALLEVDRVLGPAHRVAAAPRRHQSGS